MNTLNEIKKLMSKIDNTYKQSINEGAWGCNPADSDHAGDLRDKLIDKWVKDVKELIKNPSDGNSTKNRWTCISLIELIFDFLIDKGWDYDIDIELIKTYEEYLDYSENDEEFIDAFVHPERETELPKAFEERHKKLEEYKQKCEEWHKN